MSNERPARARRLAGVNPVRKGNNHAADSESWAGIGNSIWSSVDSKAIGSEGISAPKFYSIGVLTWYLTWKAIQIYPLAVRM